MRLNISSMHHTLAVGNYMSNFPKFESATIESIKQNNSLRW